MARIGVSGRDVGGDPVAAEPIDSKGGGGEPGGEDAAAVCVEGGAVGAWVLCVAAAVAGW